MPHSDISIIMPVFNQWELTRNCLKSLAETTHGHNIEVIVADNASTDRTAAACPFLGKQLFGEKFHFIRNERNLNFGPASNQGARLARGEYLLFLNNDTILLPGWLGPLLEDFRTFPGIAATGPLLAYPEDGIFGHRVQHLGVYVSPLNFINHLYEGIPASSPLARKRRFFQIITAACMLMPRKLFMDAGMFDEAYVNGFEDVDLCARLANAGYRMTVNPDCLVVHLQGQTPGRFRHESGNWDHWRSGNARLVHADWRELVEADGLYLKLDAGLNLRPMLPDHLERSLDQLPGALSPNALTELIIQNPYWENGWKRLAARAENASQKVVLARARAKLFNSANSKIMACEAALAVNDREEAANWLNALSSDVESMHKLRADANFLRLLSSVNKDEKLAADVAAWQEKSPEILDNYLRPAMQGYLRLSSALGIAPMPRSQYAYAAWNEVVDRPARQAEARKENGKNAGMPLISILVPVYNPEPDHLRAAIESVLAQDYGKWELCLADDASPDARIRPIIEEYAARDSRIKTAWREKNGNIAQATNTALDMATGKYCALLDQDDILTTDALSIMAEAVRQNPDGLLFYSDEDKISQFGEFYFPYFKNGKWDSELILTQNFVCHFSMYETVRLREIKGFRDGFRGSQDHDLILRFIQGQQHSRFIHVPHVLYHWRMHSGSTALSTDAKPESVDSARRAAQEYLDINCPGAFIRPIPGSHLRRVVYPLSREKPSVSLIFGPGILPPDAGLLEKWSKSASWPVQILVLIPEREANDCEHPDFVKLLPLSADLSPEMACLEAARQASGDIIGFLSPWLRPESEGWLEEIVSILWRPETGACGGMVLNRGEKALHAGYLADASFSLKPLWADSKARVAKWFNWNISTRVVDALDSVCLFTRRELFLENGGFNPAFSPWAAQDYCLRLGESGWRVIWHPFAAFALGRRLHLPPVPENFHAAWKDRLKPFNKNILIGEDLILAGEAES